MLSKPNGLLYIHAPVIERLDNGDVRMKAVFETGGATKEMWYSTTAEYGRYFNPERGDAFILPLLMYAMKRNLSVRMEAPLSERLYYTVTNYMRKVLVHVFKDWQEVDLECPVDPRPLENAGAVGTGLSCGIDSLCTVIDHLPGRQTGGYTLTHCTFFNVGGHSPMWKDAERTEKLFRQRVEHVRDCADALGLPLVVVDSNMEEIVEGPFATIATFAIISAVLALQKLFRIYYVSSGARFDEINFEGVYAGDYDLFTLPMASTETLNFFSAGTLYSRLEKTGIVADFPLSSKYLDVCLFSDRNCSKCEKCMRTLLTLDVLGKLEMFKDIFDLELYRKNRNWYVGFMMLSLHAKGSLRSIYQEMVRKGQAGFISRLYYYSACYRYLTVNKIKRLLGKEDPTWVF